MPTEKHEHLDEKVQADTDRTSLKDKHAEVREAFLANYYIPRKELYTSLERKHQPTTMLITCSDSRVIPSELLGVGPDEVFIVRNIANIVPPAHEGLDESGIISALEYGVCVLNVHDIIVCGHSNCGGCAAALHGPSYTKPYQHLSNWISYLDEPVELTKSHCSETHCSPLEQEIVLEQENVKHQLKNLMTYDFVASRVEAGTLHLLGWYYSIGTGEIHAYNPELDRFE